MRPRLRLSPSMIYPLLGWFMPPALKAEREMEQPARMFLISHIFGPLLGHTMTVYLYVLDHGVLGLSLRAEAHWGVHRAGAALRTEPDLRGAVGRLSLRRRQLALPAVAAGGAATRLLLSRARRASASYRTRHDRDERDTVLRLLCARPLLPRARAADGADRHRHHVHALCRRLRFNDGALLCEYRRQPIRARARGAEPPHHCDQAARGQGRGGGGEPRQVGVPR